MTDLATAGAGALQSWAERHRLAVEGRKGKYRLFDPVSRVHVCGYRFTASFEQIVLSLYAMDRATAWERSRKGGVRDGTVGVQYLKDHTLRKARKKETP